MKWILAVSAFAMLFQVGCGEAVLTEKDVPVIPRSVILGNPDRAAPRISPDGTRLAWIAPYEEVMNIWVADVGKIDVAKPVTKSKDRPLQHFSWDYTGNILYYKDSGGNEDFHIHRIDLATGIDKDMTPGKGFKAYILQASPDRPQEIAIMTNDRDPRFHDVKKLSLETGMIEMIYENKDGLDVILDNGFNLVAGSRESGDGGKEIFRYKDGKWELTEKADFEDSSGTFMLGLDRSGKTVYMAASMDRDTEALFEVDVATWEKRLVSEDPKSDMTDWVMLPSTGKVIATAYNYERQHWKVIDKDYSQDFEYLAKVEDADFTVSEISLEGSLWNVTYTRDDGPARYYLYDRAKGEASFLFSNRPALDGVHLARMHPRIIKSRDGLDLVCFLSLPSWSDNDEDGVPDLPLPMVLNVHGGPAYRDFWGYDPIHQFHANRGYAVLSVNFRGSWGFGKSFLNRGNGEWGGKMHEDLLDAVEWAIAQKVAIPTKVAIFGGSYGGYAVLAGLTFTPDKFACGVDIVGPSNLVTFMKSVPPYWKPYFESWKRKVGGDPDSEAGRIFLESRSPIRFVDLIQRPLLIGHGANDPRVKVAESEQIVEAMRKKGIPVAFCLYPDEGHGFARVENKRSFFAIVESFLAKNLGGRIEPMSADDFKGSSLEVKAGREILDGLDKLLPLQAIPETKTKKDK